MTQSVTKLSTSDLIIEGIAVVTGGAFTYLIGKGIIWAWPSAIVSSGLFIYLCFTHKIYAESFLHFFYVATAIYGWVTWGQEEMEAWFLDWYISLLLVVAGIGLMLLSGWLLKRYTNAALPYVDSFTTVFSIIGTFLLLMKITDNWIYFIVIDAVAVYLYFNRKLYFTTALYVVYTFLAFNAFLNWQGIETI